MDRFYLEKPSMERKNEIIEYLDEFKKYGSNINGSGSLDKIYDGYTFEEALDRCLKMESKEYAHSVGRCPGKTFLLIREKDNRIVGSTNVRWDLTESMKRFGGNIGYGIRPTERKKGYAKLQLYMALLEAKKLGLDKVMLDCNVDNIGSDKTLKALGGVLERTEADPSDGMMMNVYNFNVDEVLEKYKDLYEPYIIKEKVR